MIPIPDLSLATSSGVGGGDVIAPTTGAKYFGTSLASSSVNPAIAAKNNLKITGLIVAGLLVAFFIYKKVN